jgi:hypothetical protein
MRAPFATALAIAIGVIILLGYFIPAVQPITAVLLEWAVILAGVAGLIGIFGLVGSHFRKLGGGKDKKRDILSIILIMAFFVTLAAGIWLTPADPGFQKVVTAIQVPVETTLLAVLAISLAYACVRLLQNRKGLMPWLFILSALFFLILLSGLLGPVSQIPILNTIPLAGSRGILLGVALGSLVTGLRILFGSDRPYSG